MTDSKKAVKELEAIYDEAYDRWAHCPYIEDKLITLIRDGIPDAVILLSEQEPRIMPLDELTEIYVEFQGNPCILPLATFDLQKIIAYANNDICRLWAGKPTDQQRKAVKWHD